MLKIQHIFPVLNELTLTMYFSIFQEKIKQVFDNLIQLEHANIVKFHKYWTDTKMDKPRVSDHFISSLIWCEEPPHLLMVEFTIYVRNYLAGLHVFAFWLICQHLNVWTSVTFIPNGDITDFFFSQISLWISCLPTTWFMIYHQVVGHNLFCLISIQIHMPHREPTRQHYYLLTL